MYSKSPKIKSFYKQQISSYIFSITSIFDHLKNIFSFHNILSMINYDSTHININQTKNLITIFQLFQQNINNQYKNNQKNYKFLLQIFTQIIEKNYNKFVCQQSQSLINQGFKIEILISIMKEQQAQNQKLIPDLQIKTKKRHINQKINPNTKIHTIYQQLYTHLEQFEGYKKFSTYIGEKIDIINNDRVLINQVFGHLDTLRGKMYELCKHNLTVMELKEKLFEWIRAEFKSMENQSKLSPQKNNSKNNNLQSKSSSKLNNGNIFQDGPTLNWMVNQFLKRQSLQPYDIKHHRQYKIKRVIQKYAQMYQRERLLQQHPFRNYMGQQQISDLIKTRRNLSCSSQSSYSSQYPSNLLKKLKKKPQFMQNVFQIFYQEKNKFNQQITFHQFMGYNLSMFIHFLIRALYYIFQPIFSQLDLKQIDFYQAHRKVHVELVNIKKQSKNTQKIKYFDPYFLQKRIAAYQDQIPLLLLECIMRNKHFKKYKQNLENQFMFITINRQKKRPEQQVQLIQDFAQVLQFLKPFNMADINEKFMQMVLDADIDAKKISLKRMVEPKIKFFKLVQQQLKRVHENDVGTNQKQDFFINFIKYLSMMKNTSQLAFNLRQLQNFTIQISFYQKLLVQWQLIYFLLNTIQFTRNNFQTATIIELSKQSKKQNEIKKYDKATKQSNQKLQFYEISNKDIINYNFFKYFKKQKDKAQKTNRDSKKKINFQNTAQFFYPRSPKLEEFNRFLLFDNWEDVKIYEEKYKYNKKLLEKNGALVSNYYKEILKEKYSLVKPYDRQKNSIFQKEFFRIECVNGLQLSQIKTKKKSFNTSNNQTSNIFSSQSGSNPQLPNQSAVRRYPNSQPRIQIKSRKQIMEQQQRKQKDLYISQLKKTKNRNIRRSEVQSALIEPSLFAQSQNIHKEYENLDYQQLALLQRTRRELEQHRKNSEPEQIARDFQFFIQKVYKVNFKHPFI